MKKYILLRFTQSLLISAITLSQPLSAKTQHWQQPDYIEKSFLTIAMQREHGNSSGVLNKWQTPIRYLIDDRTADKMLHRRMVRQHLGHLADITGLSITAAEFEKANLKIIFSDEASLETELQKDMGLENRAFRARIMHDSVCLGRIAVAKDGSIHHATVLIPVDRARAHAKLMSCVVEELTQVLGLANDSTDVYPSIFNDRSFNDFLTGLDYLLLKLMYEPRLKAGMSENQVRAVIHQIVMENAFQSLIPNAVRAVRENSLENWLER